MKVSAHRRNLKVAATTCAISYHPVAAGFSLRLLKQAHMSATYPSRLGSSRRAEAERLRLKMKIAIIFGKERSDTMGIYFEKALRQLGRRNDSDRRD